MKRFLWIALTLCLAPVASHAQNFTNVTACVSDPRGFPYSFGTITAKLTPATPGGYTLGGLPYSGQLPITSLDANGCINGPGGVNMGSNAAILPASSQWIITVNFPGIAAPVGTGPQSFSTTITISGATQSITAALNAVAPSIANSSAGAASFVAQYNLFSDLFQRTGTPLGTGYTDWNFSWNAGSGAAFGTNNGGFWSISAFSGNVGGAALSPTEYATAVVKPSISNLGWVGIGTRVNGSAGTTTNQYSLIETCTSGAGTCTTVTMQLLKATYTPTSTSNTVFATITGQPSLSATTGDRLDLQIVGGTITGYLNRQSVPPGASLQCFDTSYPTGPVTLITQEPNPGPPTNPNSTVSSFTVTNAAAPSGTKINIVVDGDSTAEGAAITGRWSDTLFSPIGPASVFNLAVDGKGLGVSLPTGNACSGNTGANMESMLTTGTSVVDPLFIPGIPNFDVFLGGTNDITKGSRTPAQVYGDLTTYIANRHAVGWKVIVVPVLSNGASGGIFDNVIQAYDQLVFANTAGADAVVTLPQVLIGTHAFSNSTFFADSQTHPSEFSGKSIIAPAVTATIQRLL